MRVVTETLGIDQKAGNRENSARSPGKIIKLVRIKVSQPQIFQRQVFGADTVGAAVNFWNIR